MSLSAPTRNHPDIYSYFDYREWLRDWLGWKKETVPLYSYRVFARHARLGTGTLPNILAGIRAPSDASIEGIALATHLDARAALYLRKLVDLVHAPDLETRNRLLEELLLLPEVRAIRPLEGVYVASLSHWYSVAIRELAQLPGFRADPAWIGPRLAHPVTTAEIEAELRALLELGLLVEGEDGQVRAAELRLETPSQVQGLAYARYHEEMIGLARASIGSMRSDERFVSALTLPVPKGEEAWLRNEIFAFMKRVRAQMDKRSGPAASVQQLNIQLFPLAREPEEEPPAEG